MSRRAGWTVALLVVIAAIVVLRSPWRETVEGERDGERLRGEGDAPTSVPLERVPPGRPSAGDERSAGTPEPPGSAPEQTSVRVAGSVKEPDGTPVRGAEVRLSLERGDVVDLSASARTADDGTYATSVVVRWSDVDRSVGEVVATAVAPRHRAARRVTAPASRAGKDVRIDLVMERGASVTGRVVSAAGEPLRWASVVLCATETGARSHASTDPLGRYAFAAPAAGSYGLSASRDGYGVAIRPPVAMDPTRDLDVPDLVLRGDGSIEGRVVHPDGTPAPHLEVGAKPLAEPPLNKGCAAEESGLTEGWTVSDALGRFQLAGLKPGRYRVVPMNEPPDAPAPPEHDTGARGIVVVSHARRIVLRFQDVHGRPVPGADYEARGRSLDGETMSSAAGIARGSDAHVALEGEAGMEFRVSASTPTLRSLPMTLSVPEDRYEAEAILVLRDGSPGGRVRIAVTGTDRRPVSPFFVELTQQRSETGVISTYEFDDRDGGRSPMLEPATYDLTVWPGRAPGGPRSEAFPPVHRTVAVVDGQEQTVAISASLGGRLRLTLRPADGKESDAYQMSLRSGERSFDLWPSRFLGKDRLTRRSNVLPADEPLEHADAIEPGRYRLRVAREGFRPFETLVDIESGKTADVEVRLEPE